MKTIATAVRAQMVRRHENQPRHWPPDPSFIDRSRRYRSRSSSALKAPVAQNGLPWGREAVLNAWCEFRYELCPGHPQPCQPPFVGGPS